VRAKGEEAVDLWLARHDLGARETTSIRGTRLWALHYARSKGKVVVFVYIAENCLELGLRQEADL